MADLEKQKEKENKSKFYDASGERLERKAKFCPKCGPGVFMAEHKDRRTCGACGYTEMKSGEKKEEKAGDKKEEKKEEVKEGPKEEKKEAPAEGPEKAEEKKEEVAEKPEEKKE